MSLDTRSRDPAEGPETPSLIPGAYPTEDTSSNTAATSEGFNLNDGGKQRNKLHKPNDPRGWDVNETPRSHQFTDSGVGLPATTSGYGAQDSSYQPSTLGRDTREAFNNQPAGVTGSAPLNTSSEYSQQQQPEYSRANERNFGSDEDTKNTYTTMKAGSGADLASDTSKPTGDESATTSGDPYWGDLPRGGGVYNTVIGHGSAEDDQARHGIHDDSEPTLSRSTNAADNSSDPTQQRAFPLTGSGQEYGQTRDSTRDITRQQDDEHKKEMYAAAGVTTVGSAAYAAERDHDKKDKRAEKERETEKPKEQKESKLRALFHRSDDKDDKPAKEEKHKDKKEHARKEEHQETFVPISKGRDNYEQPKSKDEYSPSTPQTDTYRQREDNTKDSRLKEGLGLGAAGAATYGATKYAEKEHNKPEDVRSQPSNQPTQSSYGQAGDYSSYTSQTTGTRSQNTPGDPNYNTLASGTPSGVRVGDDAYANTTTNPSTTSQFEQPGHSKAREVAVPAAAAIAGAGYYASQHKSQPTEPTNESTRVNAAQQQHEYAPAGQTKQQYEYVPVEQQTKQQYEPIPVEQSKQRYEHAPVEQAKQDDHPASTFYTNKGDQTTRTEQQYPPSQIQEPSRDSRITGGEALAGGAAATGAAALAYRSHEKSDRVEDVRQTSSAHAAHHSTSSGDQYNHLASGTPSGMNPERD